MFTGLIESVGSIESISTKGNGRHIMVKCDSLFCADVNLGDSISVSGVCSTVVALTDDSFSVDYLAETCNLTTIGKIMTGELVNLEKCATPTSRLGGHIVSGHVDCTGVIHELSHDGDWAICVIHYPKEHAMLVIPKGSIALDGISLTVVNPTPGCFECHLIPHTIQHSNLKSKRSGDTVNIEFDQIGKYVRSFLNATQENDPT
tara:strand:+ start:706 stop:1317 length:612 start_codon:yes stop_codon:yes gene_type:complete